MQTDHLQYFVAVVEHGSMNKAAKALFCSQPAITAGIRTLEQELGRPILERTSDGTVPTDFGDFVYQDAKLILGYIDQWKARAQQDSLEQTVTVVFTGSAPRFRIISNIIDVQKRNPGLKINVQVISALLGQAMPADGMFRVGFLYKVPTHISETKRQAEQHGMCLAPLERDEFCLFGNERNPLMRKSGDIVLEDLRDRSVLLFKDPVGFPYIDRLASVHCRIGSQMWQEENLIVALTLDEDALSFRPCSTGDRNPYVLNGSVKVRPVVDCPMPVNICVMYPNAARITQAEKIFIQGLQQEFPSFKVF